MNDNYLLQVLTDKNEFKHIKELSQDEYLKFQQASIFMNKLNIKLFFFRMVDYAYMELKHFEKDYDAQIKINPLAVDNDVIFEFFKLLHNYLSSVNLFLNQYSANVKRDYNQDLFDEFEELRHSLYDENLSYRIIYELRNEMHHSKLPSFKLDATRNECGIMEAKIYIKKDFLNNTKLKNDSEFLQLNDLIDIYEHMENMNLCLLSLAKKILKYELDIHIEYYNFLKELIEGIEVEGKICVFKFKEFKPTGFTPSITFFNQKLIYLIDKIKEYKDEL